MQFFQETNYFKHSLLQGQKSDTGDPSTESCPRGDVKKPDQPEGAKSDTTVDIYQTSQGQLRAQEWRGLERSWPDQPRGQSHGHKHR